MKPTRAQVRAGILGIVALALSLLLAQGLPGRGATDGFGFAALAQQGNAPPPALAPALPLIGGNFEDPQQRFQIGIFDGFQMSMAGGSPVFSSADGSLAYTVTVAPLPVAETPDAALVVAATRTFGAGEGFVAGDVQPIPGGGVRINWAGRLSQGPTPPQPLTGKIFARQRENQVFLLLVAATESAAAQLSDAINALGSTLIVP